MLTEQRRHIDWTLRKMCCAAYHYLILAVLFIYWPLGISGQNLHEQDGVCNAEGCYSIHLQRKTFRESWRSCKEKGGNLATVKRPEEATLIHELLSAGERRGPRPRLRLWIGLQRQPRQCSATRPLRGFTWITGDQDTQYTNWQRDDLPSACTAPRCVVITYNTADKSSSDQSNFKWLDGSCMLAVDGFLCRYTYRGMCPALKSEGRGPALYTTPFNLLSTLLTHIPFGSVATLPCPESTKGDQSVLCMLHEDGSVGWSKDAPLCSDAPKDWCEQDNGGCEHYCVNEGSHYHCECSDNFNLGKDGQSCLPLDPCHSADCEFDCEPSSGGYRCKCPEGYLLSQDGQNCLDIDECSQNPCPQICVNAPGTFECRCHEGYQLSEFGECLDVDECKEDSCEQSCENSPGSYTCLCYEGFSPLPEDPDRCEDIDECQISGTCEQICKNYMGGFECHCETGFELHQDQYTCVLVDKEAGHYTTVEPADPTSLPWDDTSYTTDVVTDASTLEWLTDPPSMEWLPKDLGWFTDIPEENHITSQEPGWTEKTTYSLTSDAMTSSTPAGSNIDDEANLWSDDRISAAIDETVKGDHRMSTASSLAPKNKGHSDRITPSTSQMLEGSLPSAASPEQLPGGKKKQDRSWLLVALLVPLCVFIVVMLALGIVYCTSCAVEPRNKSVTDCYSWTTNSKPAKSNSAKSQA
ncbi:endosialin [Colossoma macropomum]|uniref:endosialin n=1 Tax=Colossoma macropomum TaxID=42526 RepID=UPI001863EE17|nr:endosialin [Colossoma macropomum]